jgi:trehalose-phosphatase
MRVLNSGIDLSQFLARVSGADRRLLMLDYDGTLAPFQVRPDRAVPYPGVTKSLAGLVGDERTRVVIITGRRAAELVPLLGLERRPEIWGCHGWEHLSPDGELRTQALTEAERTALEVAAEAARELTRSGARIEHKPASIALHWRGLPSLSIVSIRDRTRAAWHPLVASGAMVLLAFDGGLELRARGCNKQRAVKVLLSEAGPGSAIAYLGDDMTDEDAFAVMKPRGIGVLVRPEFRETAADIWIRPPRELLAFLGHWKTREQAA